MSPLPEIYHISFNAVNPILFRHQGWTALWGGTNYCPFGSDLEGYRKAAGQDRDIAESLAGPLDREKAKRFLERCVDPLDITRYQVTWCGRFSVPFGLVAAERTRERLGLPPLTGMVLDCGTSVSEAGIDVADLPGMGVTAPSNFHHFVGYAAIGWNRERIVGFRFGWIHARGRPKTDCFGSQKANRPSPAKFFRPRNDGRKKHQEP